jgi:hypothetical protein
MVCLRAINFHIMKRWVASLFTLIGTAPNDSVPQSAEGVPWAGMSSALKNSRHHSYLILLPPANVLMSSM